MSNWQDKLKLLGKDLAGQEQAERDKQAAAMADFRKRVLALDPIGQEVAQLADAYGVACQWEITRAGTAPGFRFRTIRPAREYGAECRQGQVFIRRDGLEMPGHLQDLTAEGVKDTLMELVLDVANAQRKPPGKKK